MGNGMPNLERKGFLKALFNQIPAFIVPRRSLRARACLSAAKIAGPLSYVPALSPIVLSPLVDCRLPRLPVSHAAIAPTDGAQLQMSCNLANRAAAVNLSHGRNLQITTLHSPGQIHTPLHSTYVVLNCVSQFWSVVQELSK